MCVCVVRARSISEEQLMNSGFFTDSVRIPEEYGSGYVASLRVNHQLPLPFECKSAAPRQLVDDCKTNQAASRLLLIIDSTHE